MRLRSSRACSSRPAAPPSLTTDFDITRIAITNPAIADAVVVAAARNSDRRQSAGHGQPDRLGQRRRALQYDLVVEQPVTTLEQHLHTLFPGEDIAVSTNEGATILAGRVSSTKVMLRAARSRPRRCRRCR